MIAFIQNFVNFLWGTPLIVLLLVTGLVFTIGSKCFQVRHFGHIMAKTFGSFFKKKESDKGVKGLITPFQAVSVAVGGSVGVGNIGGVATAIAVGGPGALFWLWVAAFLGMVMKMAEVTLAVHYREKEPDGGYYGGPTFYMQKALGRDKNFKPWVVLAIIFGLGIFSSFIFTMQNYTVSEAVSSTFNINILIISVVYLAITYIMTAGGIPKLAKMAAKIVPFMCIFYVVAGLLIILLSANHLPAVLGQVFSGAFTGTAATGGFAGAAVMFIIRTGFSRAVFSNEAGWGTSPMIHASAKTDHPVRQGLWGSFEVFVDTIIVCSITALVILLTDSWKIAGLEGASLTLHAFESVIGYAGRVIVTLGVFLFGVTTTTGWWSYFEVLIRHAFEGKQKLQKMLINIFKVIYPLPGLGIVYLSVRNSMPSSEVWLFGDMASGIPTFINLLVIIFLCPKFFALLKDYKARHMGIGKIAPDFKVFDSDD
jgi:AGCS family alanine or glycine:cation symporter